MKRKAMINMKKHYRIEGVGYAYGSITYNIVEYYLIREGYIACNLYEQHNSEENIMLDSFTVGPIADLCIHLKDNDINLFDNLESARIQLKVFLIDLVKEESFNLNKAYVNALYQIEKGLTSYDLYDKKIK